MGKLKPRSSPFEAGQVDKSMTGDVQPCQQSLHPEAGVLRASSGRVNALKQHLHLLQQPMPESLSGTARKTNQESAATFAEVRIWTADAASVAERALKLDEKVAAVAPHKVGKRSQPPLPHSSSQQQYSTSGGRH